MNEVDGSEHYERHSDEPPPSLLTIVLDTNPHAWSLLSPTLPLSKAIATILVFINAHLAFNYANKVAVVASHCQRAQWLYPSPPTSVPSRNNVVANGTGDVQMENGLPEPSATRRKMGGRAVGPGNTPAGSPAGQNLHSTITADDANKYRPFRLIEDEVMTNLRALIDSTTESDLQGTSTTMMAGALTLALTYINRETQAYEESGGVSGGNDPGVAGGSDDTEGKPGMQSRILVLSVSGDLAFQYIPIMNCIFAAQGKKIPIDICKIAGDTVFLQQASDATRGVYMHLQDPRGLLQYLMLAFLPDQTSRRHLIMPSQVNVDFRAACFCHKLVVDIGFVVRPADLDIALVVFCTPPEGAICLTCGTHLQLGDYGAKPAVVPRAKKKKRRAPTGGVRLDSVGGTPTSMGTPGPE
ncbi:MAG: RNA polymerase II transcription factor B subunit 4 [Geoglossum umbratile]|nr:MAG: RNA polymerase II transcription factor B subunit 4 [Geoglossum umbratile]